MADEDNAEFSVSSVLKESMETKHLNSKQQSSELHATHERCKADCQIFGASEYDQKQLCADSEFCKFMYEKLLPHNKFILKLSLFYPEIKDLKEIQQYLKSSFLQFESLLLILNLVTLMS